MQNSLNIACFGIIISVIAIQIFILFDNFLYFFFLIIFLLVNTKSDFFLSVQIYF